MTNLLSKQLRDINQINHSLDYLFLSMSIQGLQLLKWRTLTVNKMNPTLYETKFV